MASASLLTEQLAVLGVQLPTWPEEPEGPESDSDWIQRGLNYAEGIRLWRAQLRNASVSTKAMVEQLISHLQEQGQLDMWDQLVYAAIKPEAQGARDFERWQACTKQIRSSALTAAQILGMALEMAGEKWLLIAIHGLKRVLNEKPDISGNEFMEVCSQLVAATDTSVPMQSAKAHKAEWIRAATLHIDMTTLLKEVAMHIQGNETFGNTSQDLVPTLLKKLDNIASQSLHKANKPGMPFCLKSGMLDASNRRELKEKANEIFASNKLWNEDRKIAICTHHKCGTSFLLKTVNKIRSELGLKVWRKFYEPERIAGQSWDIVFEQHSRINDIEEKVRGLHCIRRPESLIYSATRYHEKAKEPWLDVPLEKFDHNTFSAFTTGQIYNLINDPRIELERKSEIVATHKCQHEMLLDFCAPYEFRGRTYKEMLESFKTLEDKISFEMQCYSFGVIHDIMRFDAEDFTWIKLEEISFDEQMKALRDAFGFLGFKDKALTACLNAAKSNMLAINPMAAGSHATTGISSEWEAAFDGQLKKRYNSIFGESSQILGYF